MHLNELKSLRQRYAITLIELAGWTGLPSGLIEQIEEKTVVALRGDLDRIEEVLMRLIQERESGK